ncbi:hypothetical protein KIPB_001231 [Kipferlia bialata]|uniref:Uncharacterized protein n=1 Tax=Kipferlia bialata TaxID=797122 RepID=A0A9K3CPT2_9EUKA|nr:hypothetical protein KIPB_001231 [Kipferlia bialata]|eukprot:g1231.t1
MDTMIIIQRSGSVVSISIDGVYCLLSTSPTDTETGSDPLSAHCAVKAARLLETETEGLREVLESDGGFKKTLMRKLGTRLEHIFTLEVDVSNVHVRVESMDGSDSACVGMVLEGGSLRGQRPELSLNTLGAVSVYSLTHFTPLHMITDRNTQIEAMKEIALSPPPSVLSVPRPIVGTVEVLPEGAADALLRVPILKACVSDERLAAALRVFTSLDTWGRAESKARVSLESAFQSLMQDGSVDRYPDLYCRHLVRRLVKGVSASMELSEMDRATLAEVERALPLRHIQSLRDEAMQYLRDAGVFKKGLSQSGRSKVANRALQMVMMHGTGGPSGTGSSFYPTAPGDEDETSPSSTESNMLQGLNTHFRVAETEFTYCSTVPSPNGAHPTHVEALELESTALSHPLPQAGGGACVETPLFGCTSTQFSTSLDIADSVSCVVSVGSLAATHIPTGSAVLRERHPSAGAQVELSLCYSPHTHPDTPQALEEDAFKCRDPMLSVDVKSSPVIVSLSQPILESLLKAGIDTQRKVVAALSDDASVRDTLAGASAAVKRLGQACTFPIAVTGILGAPTIIYTLDPAYKGESDCSEEDSDSDALAIATECDSCVVFQLGTVTITSFVVDLDEGSRRFVAKLPGGVKCYDTYEVAVEGIAVSVASLAEGEGQSTGATPDATPMGTSCTSVTGLREAEGSEDSDSTGASGRALDYAERVLRLCEAAETDTESLSSCTTCLAIPHINTYIGRCMVPLTASSPQSLVYTDIPSEICLSFPHATAVALLRLGLEAERAVAVAGVAASDVNDLYALSEHLYLSEREREREECVLTESHSLIRSLNQSVSRKGVKWGAGERLLKSVFELSVPTLRIETAGHAKLGIESGYTVTFGRLAVKCESKEGVAPFLASVSLESFSMRDGSGSTTLLKGAGSQAVPFVSARFEVLAGPSTAGGERGRERERQKEVHVMAAVGAGVMTLSRRELLSASQWLFSYIHPLKTTLRQMRPLNSATSTPEQSEGESSVSGAIGTVVGNLPRPVLRVRLGLDRLSLRLQGERHFDINAAVRGVKLDVNRREGERARVRMDGISVTDSDGYVILERVPDQEVEGEGESSHGLAPGCILDVTYSERVVACGDSNSHDDWEESGDYAIVDESMAEPAFTLTCLFGKVATYLSPAVISGFLVFISIPKEARGLKALADAIRGGVESVAIGTVETVLTNSGKSNRDISFVVHGYMPEITVYDSVLGLCRGESRDGILEPLDASGLEDSASEGSGDSSSNASDGEREETPEKGIVVSGGALSVTTEKVERDGEDGPCYFRCLCVSLAGVCTKSLDGVDIISSIGLDMQRETPILAEGAKRADSDPVPVEIHIQATDTLCVSLSESTVGTINSIILHTTLEVDEGWDDMCEEGSTGIPLSIPDLLDCASRDLAEVLRSIAAAGQDLSTAVSKRLCPNVTLDLVAESGVSVELRREDPCYRFSAGCMSLECHWEDQTLSVSADLEGTLHTVDIRDPESPVSILLLHGSGPDTPALSASLRVDLSTLECDTTVALGTAHCTVYFPTLIDILSFFTAHPLHQRVGHGSSQGQSVSDGHIHSDSRFGDSESINSYMHREDAAGISGFLGLHDIGSDVETPTGSGDPRGHSFVQGIVSCLVGQHREKGSAPTIHVHSDTVERILNSITQALGAPGDTSESIALALSLTISKFHVCLPTAVDGVGPTVVVKGGVDLSFQTRLDAFASGEGLVQHVSAALKSLSVFVHSHSPSHRGVRSTPSSPGLAAPAVTRHSSRKVLLIDDAFLAVVGNMFRVLPRREEEHELLTNQLFSSGAVVLASGSEVLAVKLSAEDFRLLQALPQLILDTLDVALPVASEDSAAAGTFAYPSGGLLSPTASEPFAVRSALRLAGSVTVSMCPVIGLLMGPSRSPLVQIALDTLEASVTHAGTSIVCGATAQAFDSENAAFVSLLAGTKACVDAYYPIDSHGNRSVIARVGITSSAAGSDKAVGLHVTPAALKALSSLLVSFDDDAPLNRVDEDDDDGCDEEIDTLALKAVCLSLGDNLGRECMSTRELKKTIRKEESVLLASMLSVLKDGDVSEFDTVAEALRSGTLEKRRCIRYPPGVRKDKVQSRRYASLLAARFCVAASRTGLRNEDTPLLLRCVELGASLPSVFSARVVEKCKEFLCEVEAMERDRHPPVTEMEYRLHNATNVPFHVFATTVEVDHSQILPLIHSKLVPAGDPQAKSSLPSVFSPAKRERERVLAESRTQQEDPSVVKAVIDNYLHHSGDSASSEVAAAPYVYERVEIGGTALFDVGLHNVDIETVNSVAAADTISFLVPGYTSQTSSWDGICISHIGTHMVEFVSPTSSTLRFLVEVSLEGSQMCIQVSSGVDLVNETLMPLEFHCINSIKSNWGCLIPPLSKCSLPAHFVNDPSICFVMLPHLTGASTPDLSDKVSTGDDAQSSTEREAEAESHTSTLPDLFPAAGRNSIVSVTAPGVVAEVADYSEIIKLFELLLVPDTVLPVMCPLSQDDAQPSTPTKTAEVPAWSAELYGTQGPAPTRFDNALFLCRSVDSDMRRAIHFESAFRLLNESTLSVTLHLCVTTRRQIERDPHAKPLPLCVTLPPKSVGDLPVVDMDAEVSMVYMAAEDADGNEVCARTFGIPVYLQSKRHSCSGTVTKSALRNWPLAMNVRTLPPGSVYGGFETPVCPCGTKPSGLTLVQIFAPYLIRNHLTAGPRIAASIAKRVKHLNTLNDVCVVSPGGTVAMAFGKAKGAGKEGAEDGDGDGTATIDRGKLSLVMHREKQRLRFVHGISIRLSDFHSDTPTFIRDSKCSLGYHGIPATVQVRLANNSGLTRCVDILPRIHVVNHTREALHMLVGPQATAKPKRCRADYGLISCPPSTSTPFTAMCADTDSDPSCPLYGHLSFLDIPHMAVPNLSGHDQFSFSIPLHLPGYYDVMLRTAEDATTSVIGEREASEWQTDEGRDAPLWCQVRVIVKDGQTTVRLFDAPSLNTPPYRVTNKTRRTLHIRQCVDPSGQTIRRARHTAKKSTAPTNGSSFKKKGFKLTVASIPTFTLRPLDTLPFYLADPTIPPLLSVFEASPSGAVLEDNEHVIDLARFGVVSKRDAEGALGACITFDGDTRRLYLGGVERDMRAKHNFPSLQLQISLPQLRVQSHTRVDERERGKGRDRKGRGADTVVPESLAGYNNQCLTLILDSLGLGLMSGPSGVSCNFQCKSVRLICDDMRLSPKHRKQTLMHLTDTATLQSLRNTLIKRSGSRSGSGITVSLDGASLVGRGRRCLRVEEIAVDMGGLYLCVGHSRVMQILLREGTALASAWRYGAAAEEEVPLLLPSIPPRPSVTLDGVPHKHNDTSLLGTMAYIGSLSVSDTPILLTLHMAGFMSKGLPLKFIRTAALAATTTIDKAFIQLPTLYASGMFCSLLDASEAIYKTYRTQALHKAGNLLGIVSSTPILSAPARAFGGIKGLVSVRSGDPNEI